LQAGLNGLIEAGGFSFRDAEFERKRALLQARLAEAPTRPLILALGSSLLGVGFRPDEMPLAEGMPLVFNYSFLGAGPLRQLVCLKQLLREGVRPAGCILEVHPAFLQMHEENWIEAESLDWHDMNVINRYATQPKTMWRRWCRARLAATHTYRAAALRQFLPSWVSVTDPRDAAWRNLAPSGWWETYSRFGAPEWQVTAIWN